MWNVDQLSLVTLSTVVTLFLSLVTFVTLLLSLVTFVTLLLSLVTFVTSHHVKLPNQKMIGRILVFITVASLILHASYETIQRTPYLTSSLPHSLTHSLPPSLPSSLPPFPLFLTPLPSQSVKQKMTTN
eukprot:TRINITY_DN3238_c0_g1_i1.p1 TRINITY_DN3238_c0_g1~~TRINITY_DN3238_c0_g1_i1.p1  ORF type:complete len:129 (+),score=17.53 TRINITY_DN3238_c0_g1_i1:230-616(+)